MPGYAAPEAFHFDTSAAPDQRTVPLCRDFLALLNGRTSDELFTADGKLVTQTKAFRSLTWEPLKLADHATDIVRSQIRDGIPLNGGVCGIAEGLQVDEVFSFGGKQNATKL